MDLMAVISLSYSVNIKSIHLNEAPELWMMMNDEVPLYQEIETHPSAVSESINKANLRNSYKNKLNSIPF